MKAKLFTAFSVVIIVSLLLFTTSCDSSSDNLRGKAWHLQTPNPPSVNEILEFDENGSSFSLMATDYESGGSSVLSGDYELSSTELTLNLDDGRSVTFGLIWYNDEKFSVSYNGKIDFYALENSDEDLFILSSPSY